MPTVATKTSAKSTGGKKKKLALPPYSLARNSASGGSYDVDDLFEGVVRLLEGRKNIVVLVGAGISTSVGIPDFRSKDKGLYNTLDAHSLGLSCPEDLFCIEFFRSNPRPFYKFAKHLYYPNQNEQAKPSSNMTRQKKRNRTKKPPTVPTRTSRRIRNKVEKEQQVSSLHGRALPSDSHKLLALLERKKMLLRVYTQNIDGLEASAGVSDSKIVYCHGSLRSMSCTKCSKKNLPLDERILASIKEGSVPICRIPSHKKSKAAPKANPILSPTRTSNRKKRPRALMEGYDDSSIVESPNRNCLPGDHSCCGGVLKPSITFFGETLDHSVGRKIESDQGKADALIVIGTSLSVAPISKVIEYLPTSIPRILINRTIVHPKSAQKDEQTFRKNYVFDAYMLGSCDDVTRALGKQMGLSAEIADTKADKSSKSTTKKGKRNDNQNTTYASETGAKIWSESCENDWSEISVPKERVLLFPGALPSNEGTGEKEAATSYQEIAHCDGCSKMIPIGRPIFKCCECFDYDLCHSCYPRVVKVHCGGKHSFRKE